MARDQLRATRRLVGVLSLVALVAIALGVAGFELSIPRPGGGSAPERPLPGVRIAQSTALLRVGVQSPPGGDLAFIAIEPSGNFVVTDRERRSVLRFDATGHLLAEWGPILGDVAFDEPAGIAILGDSYYVLDRGAAPRIVRLDSTGRAQDVFSLASLGPYGLNGLAIDRAGNLYAADTGRNRILVFAPTGVLLRQFGRGGTALGEFTQPMALAFAPDGAAFVADWENGRIERWDTSFTATNAWPTGFRPFGVAVDALGRVFAPDFERRRVVAYTARGAQLAELGGQSQGALEVAPRQLAFSPTQPTALFVLGNSGLVRLDLQDTPPPPQDADEVDLVSPLLMLLLVAVPVAALLLRRRRARAGSVGAAPSGKIGLQTVDRAERQQQEPRGKQDFAFTMPRQAGHHEQPADQDDQSVRDRKTHH